MRRSRNRREGTAKQTQRSKKNLQEGPEVSLTKSFKGHPLGKKRRGEGGLQGGNRQ